MTAATVIRAHAARLPLPDGSVDLIVTSPPYFGLRSYTDGCPACAERARAGNRGYMERYCPGCGKIRNRNVCPECGLTTLRTEATKAANRKTDCPECGGSGQSHYPGQIGSEATPAEWLDALLACTREWVRVLKPEGSLFVNLGDKYSTGNSGQSGLAELGKRWAGGGHSDGKAKRPSAAVQGWPPKSLLGLPWRYALACMDQLGLILRAEIVWAKPNGLPESVTDRVRRAHEQVFHFTRQPRYYSAADEIREPHLEPDRKRNDVFGGNSSAMGIRHAGAGVWTGPTNPLGKLPGSVWNIPSQPLTVPPHVGVDHFAAFPMELPRRLILGWSPPGVCTACGQGRRPVVDRHNTGMWGLPKPQRATGPMNRNGHSGWDKANHFGSAAVTITAYACACTIVTSTSCPERLLEEGANPGHTSGPEAPPTRPCARTDVTDPDWTCYYCHHEPDDPRYDDGTPIACDCSCHRPRPEPPTRPAVVLDPFGGTGTTALVASVLGRHGISVDLSADYGRLAKWRVNDPGERARAMCVPKPPPQVDGQDALFEVPR